MTKVSKETDFKTWRLQWIARGISILFMVFILLIWINCALAGNQWREAPLSQLVTPQMIGIFIAYLVGIVMAWSREETGGTLLTIVAIMAIIIFILWNESDDYWMTLINGVPFLVSGILFLICRRRIKKAKILQKST